MKNSDKKKKFVQILEKEKRFKPHQKKILSQSSRERKSTNIIQCT